MQHIFDRLGTFEASHMQETFANDGPVWKMGTDCSGSDLVLAALETLSHTMRPKMKLKSIVPPDPCRNQIKPSISWEHVSPDPPPDPRRGKGPRTKSKTVLRTALKTHSLKGIPANELVAIIVCGIRINCNTCLWRSIHLH